MKRVDLLRTAAAGTIAAGAGLLPRAAISAAVSLAAPANKPVPVAVLLSERAVVIDFAGPWEVFQDTSIPGRDVAAFELYTVAQTTKPLMASSGLSITPNYSYANVPPPKVIVIPAQSASDPATLDWIRAASRNADLTMSVCVGAFLLASTGLLAGKSATTHHASYSRFAMTFRDVNLRRGARFVDEGNIASAGGLSSGIDLALHVVERYYGRDVATKTAYRMEYQGLGWKDPASNAEYAHRPTPSAGMAQCPVCWMDADPKTASAVTYRDVRYRFCSASCKDRFSSSPITFVTA
jgi:transcriptional regulator GlxA family with amidase domain/YHS domain-containing protein